MPAYFRKVVLFVAIVLIAFAYLGFQIPQQESRPPEVEKFDPAAIKTKEDLVRIGQKIFFGKGQCALCHATGPGQISRCPNLAGVGGKLSREFIYETLTKPEAFIYMQYEFSPAKPFAAKMPAINKPPIGLNDNELLAVIAFVQSIGGEVTVDPSEIVLPVAAGAIRGDAEAGKTVFKKTGCMKCHSVGSEKGGTEGPDLYPLLRRSDGLSLQRTVETVMASRSHQGIDQRLTVRDFNDLMAYLARFKGESGSL